MENEKKTKLGARVAMRRKVWVKAEASAKIRTKALNKPQQENSLWGLGLGSRDHYEFMITPRAFPL